MQTQTDKLPFRLSPTAKERATPYLEYLDAKYYLEELAPSTCRVCKVRRVRRLVAQGEFGRGGNPCKLSFDYCPKCWRLKPESKHQQKMMVLVKNIKPLSPDRVHFENKLAQVETVTLEELNSWRKAPSGLSVAERGNDYANQS
jgi:hypothetical protein